MDKIENHEGSIRWKAYHEVLTKTHDFLDSFRDGRMDLAIQELNYLLEMTRIISRPCSAWKEEIAKSVEENKYSPDGSSNQELNIKKEKLNGATDLEMCIDNTLKDT